MGQDAFLHFSDVGSIEEFNSLFEEDEDEKEDEAAEAASRKVLMVSHKSVKGTVLLLATSKQIVESGITHQQRRHHSTSELSTGQSAKGTRDTCADYKRTDR